MASITLKDIYKVYPGGVDAVNDFNLVIEDREFLILVGPSGCGKSTTLRMIAGLEEITRGELYIGDKLVNTVPSKDRDIAMVFQNYALYPHMTVFKNMAFGLQLRKVPKKEIEARVLEVAKTLDIVDYLERKPKALSGGQRQRVALGRAMVRDPQVFLLDEPLSNLDAKLRNAMRTEITLLHKRLGTTFVYVTHDQVEAMTMGDRIVVMKDGFIQQVDTPQNLYDRPANIFVAGFIGTPQMNFLPARIRKTQYGFAAIFADSPFLISPEYSGKTAAYEGRDITIGIRPEHLYLETANMEPYTTGIIHADVNLVELMGSETHLYLASHGTKLIAKVPSNSKVRDGERLRVAVDCTKIHLFDNDTGKSIV